MELEISYLEFGNKQSLIKHNRWRCPIVIYEMTLMTFIKMTAYKIRQRCQIDFMLSKKYLEKHQLTNL